jgi:hypothetical protein
MKKIYSHFWLLLLVSYSLILIFVEIKTSQDYVHYFYADIEGKVLFYAVNTTLTISLMLATSLMFKVNSVLLPREKNNVTQRFFYLSQAYFFCYLAFDDRFLIHEKLGYILGINDAFIILSLGVTEIALILTWGNYQQWKESTKSYLFKAAICFAIMVIMDGFFPQEVVLRLSLEDLSKTWANVFLFLFAWDIFRQNITTLRQHLPTTQP